MQHFPSAVVLALALSSTVVSAADLEVTVKNIESAQGDVRVDLHTGPDGFRHEDQSLRILERTAAVGTVTVRFEGLEPGRYAVIAYHDENGDGKMNRFLGMVPSEDYGLSRNPTVVGPPKFRQAAFDVPPDGARSSSN